MKLAKLLACGVMAAGLLSAAGIAHAADVTITNVAVGNGSGDYGSATVGGYGNLWTTPLILTDSTGHTYVTFCDDIPDHIYVGASNYVFTIKDITTTEAGAELGGARYNSGNSQSVSLSISNRMGQIAELGKQEYQLFLSSSDVAHEKAAVGAQLAIWSLEYGIASSAITADTQALTAMNADLALADNGLGPARGLFSQSNPRIQGQILGLNSAAPEPAAWALMMVGVGGMGAALRTRRRKAIAAA